MKNPDRPKSIMREAITLLAILVVGGILVATLASVVMHDLYSALPL